MPDMITLDQNTESIQYLCKKDKRLAKVISAIGPVAYPLHPEPYSFLIHEIIEQMLSIKAGAKIYGRLEELCGGCISAVSIGQLSDEEIRGIGTSRSKVKYIRGLTDALESGYLDLEELETMNDAEVMNKLTSLHGIGIWTAKMYLIFVLNRQDVLPHEDAAFLQAYEWLYKTKDRSKAAVEKKCRKWKPYSSIAARYLYRALDTGLTKNEFHLYQERKES